MFALSVPPFAPLLAYYAWYGGWWWWIIAVLFIWIVFAGASGWRARRYGYGGPSVMPSAMPSQTWQTIESSFFESPDAAVSEADRVVTNLIDVRKGADRASEAYRSAHEVAIKASRHEASFDELRTAMLAYRSLYTRLA